MSDLNKLSNDNTIENGRKYLFLRQIEMLDGFLKTGAISRAQYDFSYSGLVTKMNVTNEELSEWIGEKTGS